MTYEELKAARQASFQRHVARLGNKVVAALMKCKASYVSQLCSGIRPITERTARNIEVALGIKPKSLDRKPTV